MSMANLPAISARSMARTPNTFHDFIFGISHIMGTYEFRNLGDHQVCLNIIDNRTQYDTSLKHDVSTGMRSKNISAT